MFLKLAVFDLDGTIMNAYDAIFESLNYTLKKLNYPEESYETAKRTVGYGDKKFLERFVKPEDFEQAVKLYRDHHLQIIKEKVSCLPGAKETLSFLKEKGVFLAVASNRPGVSAIPILQNLGIANYFQKAVFSDTTAHLKPHPEMIEQALSFFHVPKNKTIFVGDMTIDIQTGKNAGVFTVGIATGSSLSDELQIAGPNLLFESLFGFLDFLKDGFLEDGGQDRIM